MMLLPTLEVTKKEWCMRHKQFSKGEQTMKKVTLHLTADEVVNRYAEFIALIPDDMTEEQMKAIGMDKLGDMAWELNVDWDADSEGVYVNDVSVAEGPDDDAQSDIDVVFTWDSSGKPTWSLPS